MRQLHRNILEQVSTILRVTLVLFVLFSLTVQPVVALTVTDELGSNLREWYNSNSGSSSSRSDFGSYVIQALEDKVYLGLNKGFPSNDLQAPVLASFDGSSLAKVATIGEDALYRIKSNSSKLFIPGYDPNGSDGWDAGNFYIYDPDTTTLTKKRYRHDSYQFVDSTTTDSSGNWSFTGLKPTAYQIKVIKPANYIFTTQNVLGTGNILQETYSGWSDEYDSDFSSTGEFINCATGYPSGIRFFEPFTDSMIDAGLRSSPGAAAGSSTSGTRDESYFTGDYTIGDKVWLDANNNGRQDSGESGVSGVRIELYTKDPYFPCAIHMPGAWVDGDTIYATYGYTTQRPNFAFPAHYDKPGVNATAKSTDGGETWELVGEYIGANWNFYSSEDSYFPYDVYKFGDRLFAMNFAYVNNWAPNPWIDGLTTRFIYSDNNGADWTLLDQYIYYGLRLLWTSSNPSGKLSHVYGMRISPTGEIIKFRDKLQFLGSPGNKIVRVLPETYEFEDVEVTGVNFNVQPDVSDPDLPLYNSASTNFTHDEMGNLNNWDTLAVANDEYMYAIGENKKIYVTSNGRDWNTVTDFSTIGGGTWPTAIEYWPDQDKIVVSTSGETGRLYSFDHSDAIAEVMTLVTDPADLNIVDAFEPTIDLSETAGTRTIDVYAKDDGVIVGKFQTTLSGTTVDLSMVGGAADRDSAKSVITNAENAPGAADTHTLYVPIPEGKDSPRVTICPHAQNLSEVIPSCFQSLTLTDGQSGDLIGHQVSASKTDIDGITYWVVSGVTGTGGFAQVTDSVSSAIATAPSCTDAIPWGEVDLFQIDRTESSATLFFTPASGAVKDYHVMYGYDEGDERFASIEGVTSSPQDGVQVHTINDLDPKATYWFKVIAVNGCAFGEWSEWLKAEATEKKQRSFFKYF